MSTLLIGFCVPFALAVPITFLYILNYNFKLPTPFISSPSPFLLSFNTDLVSFLLPRRKRKPVIFLLFSFSTVFLVVVVSCRLLFCLFSNYISTACFFLCCAQPYTMWGYLLMAHVAEINYTIGKQVDIGQRSQNTFNANDRII